MQAHRIDHQPCTGAVERPDDPGFVGVDDQDIGQRANIDHVAASRVGQPDRLGEIVPGGADNSILARCTGWTESGEKHSY